MVEKMEEITDMIIPGITWKQVVAFASAIVFLMWMFFSVRAQSVQAKEQSIKNGESLELLLSDKKETDRDKKETDRLLNIRLTAIELDQREFRIRLTSLENK